MRRCAANAVNSDKRLISDHDNMALVILRTVGVLTYACLLFATPCLPDSGTSLPAPLVCAAQD